MSEAKTMAPVNLNALTNKAGDYKQATYETSGKKVTLKKGSTNLVDGPYGGKKAA